MNPALSKLQPYPFERLRGLLAGAQPPAHLKHIPLYIGEPRHAPPAFALEALTRNLDGFGSYPLTIGIPQLRVSIANWLTRRFQLPAGSLEPDSMILPVNGTREALFAFAQAIVDRTRPDPIVVCPNPFYQIYEGAALLAGAEPVFLNQTADTHFDLDLDALEPAIPKPAEQEPYRHVPDRRSAIRRISSARRKRPFIASGARSRSRMRASWMKR